jgi:hypothetical protein
VSGYRNDRGSATDGSAAALTYSPPSGAVATRHSCQIDTRVRSAAKRSMSIKQGRKRGCLRSVESNPRQQGAQPLCHLERFLKHLVRHILDPVSKTSRIGWVLRNEQPEMLMPTVTLLRTASRMKRYSPNGTY